MKREFSAGGVLVRRLRGRWHVAAIRPAGKPPGLWALPKGRIDEGEKGEETALREVQGGNGNSSRERVFGAVIDKAEVKTLGELSPREIEHDNPEIRRTEEFAHFLGQLYNRDVSSDDTVTVIRFSPIRGGNQSF